MLIHKFILLSIHDADCEEFIARKNSKREYTKSQLATELQIYLVLTELQKAIFRFLAALRCCENETRKLVFTYLLCSFIFHKLFTWIFLPVLSPFFISTS